MVSISITLENSMKSKLTTAIKDRKFNQFGVIFENFMNGKRDTIGVKDITKIINQLRNPNEEEFLNALPRLIESSDAFKQIFLKHPQAKEMLKQSMKEVKANYELHKHDIAEKEIRRKHVETQKGHITVLENLLKQIAKTKPEPTKEGHWMSLRPTHALSMVEKPKQQEKFKKVPETLAKKTATKTRRAY